MGRREIGVLVIVVQELEVARAALEFQAHAVNAFDVVVLHEQIAAVAVGVDVHARVDVDHLVVGDGQVLVVVPVGGERAVVAGEVVVGDCEFCQPAGEVDGAVFVASVFEPEGVVVEDDVVVHPAAGLVDEDAAAIEAEVGDGDVIDMEIDQASAAAAAFERRAVGAFVGAIAWEVQNVRDVKGALAEEDRVPGVRRVDGGEDGAAVVASVVWRGAEIGDVDGAEQLPNFENLKNAMPRVDYVSSHSDP